MPSDPEPLTIGILGLGHIGTALVEAVRESASPLAIRALYGRTIPDAVLQADHAPAPAPSLAAFLDPPYRVMVECASQKAVRDALPAALACGHDVLLASSGALVDDRFRFGVLAAARLRGRRIYLAAGALGSLEILAVLKHAGLEHVSLVTHKPPRLLPGFEGEDRARTVFAGSARDAAALFPQILNIAATLGLWGIGLDRTQVTLKLDPALTRSRHEIVLDGTRGRYRVILDATTARCHPSKSALTPDSLLHVLRAIAAGGGALYALTAPDC